MDRNDKVKVRYEKVRESLVKRLREKYDRVLPLDEMLSDRWKKAKLLGFGEGTSVCVYGKPKIGKNVWVGHSLFCARASPFGDRDAGEKIAQIVERELT